jgi:hypothetical protein
MVYNETKPYQGVIMIITYAVKVTAENMTDIIEDAAEWYQKVNPKYDLEEATEFGEDLYAILSVNYEYRHATFTMKWGSDFRQNWTETGETNKFWKVVTLNQ